MTVRCEVDSHWCDRLFFFFLDLWEEFWDWLIRFSKRVCPPTDSRGCAETWIDHIFPARFFHHDSRLDVLLGLLVVSTSISSSFETLNPTRYKFSLQLQFFVLLAMMGANTNDWMQYEPLSPRLFVLALFVVTTVGSSGVLDRERKPRGKNSFPNFIPVALVSWIFDDWRDSKQWRRLSPNALWARFHDENAQQITERNGTRNNSTFVYFPCRFY